MVQTLQLFSEIQGRPLQLRSRFFFFSSSLGASPQHYNAVFFILVLVFHLITWIGYPLFRGRGSPPTYRLFDVVRYDCRQLAPSVCQLAPICTFGHIWPPATPTSLSH